MVETSVSYTRARRAYELGRLQTSAWRAAAVGAPIAAVAWVSAGSLALAWVPVSLAAWVIAFWRGRAVQRGAFYGLAGGVVTSLLPMSILRPCCAPGAMMTADCCTMPGACLAAGGVVGVVMAALVPVRRESWWQTALGLILGVGSVAVFRCATLFAGEAFGLAGGVAAGLIAASAARSLLAPRRVSW